jgi:ABC-type methionine transport system ATPase subunit
VRLLSLERVTVRRGPEPVLSEVNFEIAEGELVGVFVRVQAGRATLLRVASGLEQPERGRVLFDGRPVVPNLVLGQVGGIGYCLDRFKRELGSSVVAQVSMPLLAPPRGWSWRRRRRVRVPQAEARAFEMLDRVGARGCADKAPDELDHEERARVMIARALLGRPRLLLIDNPTDALGATRRDQVLTLLHSVTREDGIAVLFTTAEVHGLEGVDRPLILDAGRLREHPPPNPSPLVARLADRRASGR